jgi:hypothetical protein
VAALDSLDLHDQSMLAWAQVVQMTTMLRLFEEDVSTASIKTMAEQFATLLIVASSWSSIISDSVCATGNIDQVQMNDEVSIIQPDLLERETHLRMYWVSTIDSPVTGWYANA